MIVKESITKAAPMYEVGTRTRARDYLTKYILPMPQL